MSFFMRNARCSFMISSFCDFISSLNFTISRTNYVNSRYVLYLSHTLNVLQVIQFTHMSVHIIIHMLYRHCNARCTWMISSRYDFINFTMINWEHISRTNDVNYRCFHYHLNHEFNMLHVCNSTHTHEPSRRSSHIPSFSSTTHTNLM